MVKTFVGLSPDLGPGIVTFSVICDVVGDVPWCDPAVWQQRAGSNYYDTLEYENKAFVPTTLVWTEVSFASGRYRERC